MGVHEEPYQGTFSELSDGDNFQTVEEDGAMGKEAYQKIYGQAFLIDKRDDKLVRSPKAETAIVDDTRVRFLGTFEEKLPIAA